MGALRGIRSWVGKKTCKWRSAIAMPASLVLASLVLASPVAPLDQFTYSIGVFRRRYSPAPGLFILYW